MTIGHICNTYYNMQYIDMEIVGKHHQFMKLGKLWDIVRDWEAWSAAVHGVTKS